MFSCVLLLLLFLNVGLIGHSRLTWVKFHFWMNCPCNSHTSMLKSSHVKYSQVGTNQLPFSCTKARSDCCKLPLNTTEEEQETAANLIAEGCLWWIRCFGFTLDCLAGASRHLAVNCTAVMHLVLLPSVSMGWPHSKCDREKVSFFGKKQDVSLLDEKCCSWKV